MKRFFCSLLWLLIAAVSLHVVVLPAFSQSEAATTSAIGSSKMDGDGYVYISGQGPRRTDGSLPAKFPEQVRQALENVKKQVEASGLTMKHVVYVQVYLEDSNLYSELNEAFADYFSAEPPARAVLGVARLPDPGIQITAVAVRDLTDKRPVAPSNFPPSKAFSYGMLTHDRLFVSTMPGSDPVSGAVPSDPALQVNLALDRMKSVVEAAGLTMAHMVFVNPYMTLDLPPHVMNEQYAKRFEFGNTPGRATIKVSSLPEGTHIAYTGVAVRDLSKRHAIRPKNMPPSPTASPCVFAGDTLYCSAKDGFIPGPNEGVYAASTGNQARQSMRNQLDNLEEAGMTFDDVVYTTIYLDDLSDTPEFAKIYKKYFNRGLPAATILQQLKPGGRKEEPDGEYPPLEQVSLIAI